MQTENLNQTQSAPQTANPQKASGTDIGSQSSDFQQAATQDALNQGAQQSLSVQNNGEPLTGRPAASAGDSVAYIWWAVLILAVIVVGSILGIKYFNEDAQEPAAGPSPKKSAAASKKKAATVKKPAKTKSGKPAKKRKTAAKKRSRR